MTTLVKAAAAVAALTLVSACGGASTGSTITYQTQAAYGCGAQTSGYATSREGLPMRCGPQEQSPWERPAMLP